MVIKSSFDKFNPFINEDLFGIINNFCLECIAAYDLTNNKNFLKLSNYIYSKDLSALNQNSSLIIRINQLQINLRLNGQLSDEETNELIEIKLSKNKDEQVQFCASVLLGSNTEANWFFSKFDDNIQSSYERFPIYTLYKNLN